MHTDSLKGIAAVLIVFHHLSQQIAITGPLKIMGYIGIITVALFFFLSGYGLMFGLKHKENYLKGFLKRKIVPILIPYELVNFCCLLWKLMTGQKIDFIQSIFSFLGWYYLSGLWFVTAILIFYIFFWLSYRNSSKQGNIRLLSLTIIYVFVVTYYGLHSCWTASIFSFFMGIVWDDYRERFEMCLRDNYWSKLAIITVLFLGAFLGRLYISSIGFNGLFIQICFRNIVCILFVLWVIVVLQKITFSSVAWKIIGDYSLEIYIAHYVLKDWFSSIADKSTIYVFTVIGLTIFASLIIKRISTQIANRTIAKSSA